MHGPRTEDVGDDRRDLDIERAMDGRELRERHVAVLDDSIQKSGGLQITLDIRTNRTITDHFEACVRDLLKRAGDRPGRGIVDLVTIQSIHHAHDRIRRDRTPRRLKDLERGAGIDDGIPDSLQTEAKSTPFGTEHQVLFIGAQPGVADHTVTLDDRNTTFHRDPGDEVVPGRRRGRGVIVTEVKDLRPVTIEDPLDPGSKHRDLRVGHERPKPDADASGDDVMRGALPRGSGEIDDELLGTADLQIRDRMQHPRLRGSRGPCVPIRAPADEAPDHPSPASEQIGSTLARRPVSRPASDRRVWSSHLLDSSDGRRRRPMESSIVAFISKSRASPDASMAGETLVIIARYQSSKAGSSRRSSSESA